MNLKCTVIDDEPFALDLMREYILKTPSLILGDCFTNPLKAIGHLNSEPTDLLFLDINMPEITGVQLLKSLPVQPLVIFTTAYPEYGAESYEYNAVDYLLKPFRYERFLKAVNKAEKILMTKKTEKNNPIDAREAEKFIFIKSGVRLIKINPDEILYIEGAGNYMIFHTTDHKIPSLMTMNEVLDILNPEDFSRIHKSYIVAINHIEAIEKHDVIINKKPVPIGITYREQFLSRLHGK